MVLKRFRLHHQKRVWTTKKANYRALLESLRLKPQTLFQPSMTSFCSFQPTVLQLCNSPMRGIFHPSMKPFRLTYCCVNEACKRSTTLEIPFHCTIWLNALQVVKCHSCKNYSHILLSWCVPIPLSNCLSVFPCTYCRLFLPSLEAC